MFKKEKYELYVKLKFSIIMFTLFNDMYNNKKHV